MISTVSMSEANKPFGYWVLCLNKFRFSSFLLLAAGILLIAGCGGGSSPSPGAQRPDLTSIAWSGSQFVVVGYLYEPPATGVSYGKGIILTSPDGNAWTTSLSDGAKGLNCIIWNGSRFVVGSSNAILTSADGLVWTQSTTMGGSIYGVVWSGAQFVAVGGDYNETNNTDTGFTLTSPDAFTWTARTSGTPYTFHDVAWSGSQYVAVAGGLSHVTAGTILTSPDGITWTSRLSDPAYKLSGITWSGTQFVAVGGTATTPAILTSPDGITWTPRTSGTLGSLYGVIWSGSQFVAVGGTGSSGVILTSPDGITWADRTAGVAYNLLSAAWSGSQFVAVGLNGEIVRSPDGITWTVSNL